MRTTLTIDDDIAVALERVREKDDMSLKAIVNEALRRGLRVMEAESAKPAGERYRIRPWNSGGMRISMENVPEALAWAEGEGWK
jgi:hypothetical protein